MKSGLCNIPVFNSVFVGYPLLFPSLCYRCLWIFLITPRHRYKLLVGVDARKWNSMGLRQQVSQNVPQLSSRTGSQGSTRHRIFFVSHTCLLRELSERQQRMMCEVMTGPHWPNTSSHLVPWHWSYGRLRCILTCLVSTVPAHVLMLRCRFCTHVAVDEIRNMDASLRLACHNRSYLSCVQQCWACTCGFMIGLEDWAPQSCFNSMQLLVAWTWRLATHKDIFEDPSESTSTLGYALPWSLLFQNFLTLDVQVEPFVQGLLPICQMCSTKCCHEWTSCRRPFTPQLGATRVRPRVTKPRLSTMVTWFQFARSSMCDGHLHFHSCQPSECECTCRCTFVTGVV